MMMTALAMSNFHLDICARGRDLLLPALTLAMRGRSVTGYRLEAARVVLLAHAPAGQQMTPLLAPARDAGEVAGFLWPWLEAAEPLEARPDIDGDTVKGWRLYAGVGRIRDDWGSLCAVQPCWAEIGK